MFQLAVKKIVQCYTIFLYYTCIFLRLNLFILSVVPTPDLSLNHVNPPILSDQLTLECSATVVRGITSTLDFMWIRIDDDSEMMVQNVTRANTTGDSLVYTDIYTTPMALMESDIGVVYVCMITLNAEQQPITNELNITLDTSISKYMYMMYTFLMTVETLVNSGLIWRQAVYDRNLMSCKISLCHCKLCTCICSDH